MAHAISLEINGLEYKLEIEGWETLLDILRDRLNLTGTKRNCDIQVCGNCTVLVNGEAVSSCCTLALDVNGSRVTTIEGLGRGGDLHPLQRAFIEKGAVQCGFCTPGMIMMAVALLNENPRPTEAQARSYMMGNLCRCTGYVKITEAILAAASNPPGSL